MKLSEIKFHLGDDEHSVNAQEVTPEMSLNKYLREVVHLVGTKRMCLEGGCASCLVVVEDKQKGKIFAVHSHGEIYVIQNFSLAKKVSSCRISSAESDDQMNVLPSRHRKRDLVKITANETSEHPCLVSIFSCHGWKIHTIEGIDNGKKGPHPVQKALSDFNGTQCGFCSSGMVMNMYALYQNGNLTMEKVENSFGGNICRCTGYRPILTAFKSLAQDASYELLGIYPDIEDIQECFKTKCKVVCEDKCKKKKMYLEFETPSSRWVKVYRLADIFEVLKTSTYETYMLIAGNTAQGVYRPKRTPDLYIDVTEVAELTKVSVMNNSLILGANVTLANTMDTFYKVASRNSKFSYLKQVADHIDLVANLPVRNIGTLAGNLMIKHDYHEFPSDIFLTFETVGAILTVDDDESEQEMSPAQFIITDMRNKVIKSITFPALDSSKSFYTSFKIMPRAQNVRAHVNAGFLLTLNGEIVTGARIVYGSINPSFIHASNTEFILLGKPLFDTSTLRQAFLTLDTELNPNVMLPDPPPEYRKQLAMALFYKCILRIAPSNKIAAVNKSGEKLLERPLSNGVQDYSTNKSVYPLTEPVIKLEALAQTTGSAKYVDDIPDFPNQLHAAFVTTNAPANSIVTRVDPSAALRVKGVVAFLGKDDIPGENTFTPRSATLRIQEELFCSGRVQYYFQPVGIIVANSREIAESAAEIVTITYTRGNRPLLNPEQVIQANATDRISTYRLQEPKRRGNDIQKIIKGIFRMGYQYHYHMEVQCCVVIPVEDGLDIYPASQWMDLTQLAAAAALNIPANRINVMVRRLGGAFGGKLSRNALITTAASLAAWKLKKPVRMWMPFDQNMNVIGKRDPIYCEYEVGVNNTGTIQFMNISSYTDYGVGGNDRTANFVYDLMTGCYNTDTWKIAIYEVKTDNHGVAWTRAPGALQGTGVPESIMDHIAYELNLDPLAVRHANFDLAKKEVIDVLSQAIASADVDNRKKEVEKFNKENRWKKKGLSIVTMAYTINIDYFYPAYVTVFHGDSTVCILHGGTEMGQGINTKAAQVCAYKLGIPLEKVAVKPSYNNVSPNVGPSGGSLTSEAVCYAVTKACDNLLAKMKPYRDQLKNPTWEQVVARCFAAGAELFGTGSYSKLAIGDINNYVVYGSCVTEIELDVLTGQHIVRRVDIFEDTGSSMSPLIDVGQIEGAFVMGLGYYTTENIVRDVNGKLLTNRTWTYWPPTAKDIPVDFRVKFLSKPNPAGVLYSKATAEPPMCLSVGIPLAIREAVASARSDASNNTASKWFAFDGPTTIENTFMNCLNTFDHYTL